ncbi:MAG: hypothetical protein GY940_45235 [bacterium]|nr:hypothetical protein [bacterium]
MAKCVICTAKKGKRYCKIQDALICSLCCGETRTAGECTGCPHYKETGPQRKYRDVPRFSLQRMDDDFQLQDYGNAIESTILAYNSRQLGTLNDNDAIRTLELLLDKYYFKENDLKFENSRLENIFAVVENTINDDLGELDHQLLSKLIATIHFVAKRRSKGNREYLDFILRYVGVRTGKGSRLMFLPDI